VLGVRLLLSLLDEQSSTRLNGYIAPEPFDHDGQPVPEANQKCDVDITVGDVSIMVHRNRRGCRVETSVCASLNQQPLYLSNSNVADDEQTDGVCSNDNAVPNGKSVP
jgi:hypothetical protein